VGPGPRLGAVPGRAPGAALNRLLLDTTFLIDAERSGADLDQAIGDDDDVAISAVSLAELAVGVLLSSGKGRAARQSFLDDVVGSIPAVAYDESVARDHAELLAHVRREGSPRDAHDLIIAATAKATDRTVVTADATAFEGLPGVRVRQHR
jgi:tRNA(fMet)-specific endonuclease VapC